MARPETHVMVVDDDAAIRDVVTQVLLAEGYCVLAAADGDSALEIAERTGPVSVILLDLYPPQLGARQFVTRYRQRPPPHASVVLFTALSSEEAALQADGLGAAAVLRKPFDLDTLLSMVARFSRHPQSPAALGNAGGRAAHATDVKGIGQHYASVQRLQRDLAAVSDTLAATRVESWTLLQLEARRPLTADEQSRAARLRRDLERLRFELDQIRHELAVLQARGRAHP